MMSSPPQTTMPLRRRIWITGSILFLLTVLVAGAIYLWRLSSINGDIIATAPLDSSCDLQQGACQVSFQGGGRVKLSITPRPIQGLKPLQLRVQTEGVDAQAVEVDFRGLGMNMGYNRPRLDKESAGEYAGMGVLSACILERMSWEATVLLRTAEGVMAAPFQFETIRP